MGEQECPTQRGLVGRVQSKKKVVHFGLFFKWLSGHGFLAKFQTQPILQLRVGGQHSALCQRNRAMASISKQKVSLVRIIGGRRYWLEVSPYSLVSSTEAARILGYGLRHLYRLVQEERLKITARRGGKVFFRLIDLYRLKESLSQRKKSTEKEGGKNMATKNELQDRLSDLEGAIEEILGLADEIRDKARQALETDEEERNS